MIKSLDFLCHIWYDVLELECTPSGAPIDYHSCVVFSDGTFTQLLRQWPEENNTHQTIDNYVTRGLFLTKMTVEY